MTQRNRRGNYVVMLIVALMTLLGFGALAVDTGYMMIARSQAQDIADAASQAGLIVLRQTGSTTQARSAAERIVASNHIASEAPELISLAFGRWDDTRDTPTFINGAVNPNAVRAVVGRRAGNAVPFLIARIWGFDTFDVRASATSASRSAQVVIVMDITGSWGEADFNNGRAAVVTALDLLTTSASPQDEVAMTVFSNRYSWEYTPFTNIFDRAAAATVKAKWELLAMPSKAGKDTSYKDGKACTLNASPNQNNFNNPVGGCYPWMPREYTDEPGTDHTTGITLARQLYIENVRPAAYRAMIVVTDGRPAALGSASGTIRAQQGHVETRYREFKGPVPRTVEQIRAGSIALTNQMWNDMNVHTWVVSLVADDPMMPAMVRGDGYYVRTTSSARLAAILGQIISEIPLAIVE